jgi:exopolyphosphatase/guanosine-5'-triphosphate,3'-diphosphate pyrophosphatase
MLDLAAVVGEYEAAARAAGARRVRTVATAAIRGAANAEDVVGCVRDRSGVTMEVLPGEEEARLAFLGATRTLGRAPEGTLAVLDIGGASSEIAVGTVADGVHWCCSFAIGSSYLAEAHQRGDPPTAEELAAMRSHAADVFGSADVPQPDEAVAVGGSATALCRMGGAVLDGDSLRRAAELICRGPAAVVAREQSLDEERVRVLPAGILLLDAAARRLGCPLQVGRGGLREGVCLELAGGPD